MPDLASITISSGSIALALSSGVSGKLRAAGVAAGIGDQPRLLDLVAIDLDQAVDRLALQLRRVVLVAVPFRIGRGVGSRKSADRSTTLVFGALPSRSAITFCVVACGSAQNARSSAAFFQSTSSIETSFGSSNGENCGNTARISCPARRSAVSSTSSACGWRSSSRTSSEPV